MNASNSPLAVLLVEDNCGDAELTRLALVDATMGDALRVVGNLQDALSAIKTAPSDVILLDLGLPDTSGLEGVQAIAHLVPETPIVVLSGMNSQQMSLSALESGAQDYLVKGEFSPGLLSRAIRYSIERKRSERELLAAARFDAVTGLVNRRYFLGLLDHALDRARRNTTAVDVLFLDLDHFKNINDTLGHAAGDALLRQVANRLKHCVRTSDIVARLGGDEFIVMVEDTDSASDAVAVANKILQTMRAAFTISGVEVLITPSIGIAGYPQAGDDAPTLLQHADTAMYRAKSLGRNTVEFFTETMNVSVRQSFELEMDLRRALQKDEFELHYQPIMERISGRVTAVEALLRWHRGGVAELTEPDHFLPLLESTGLIHEVGDWVLRTACAQCRSWQQSLQSDLRVAVNVSPRQLAVEGFAERVAAVLKTTGLAAASLEIEITEQVLLTRSDENIATLQEIHKLGVAIAIDDFGSGYSSLGYLTVFPFDTVKIDGGFIQQVALHRDNAIITSGILSIANGLGRHVIAEGVETQAQLDFLEQHQCHDVQGFLLSKPLSIGDFESYCGGSSEAHRMTGS